MNRITMELGVFILAVMVSPIYAEENKHQQQHLLTLQAMEFFIEWDRLAKEFDPKLAELYSDAAVITTKRIYPNEKARKMKLTGAQYKAIMGPAMPLARARGDVSYYSDVAFEVNEAEVVITCSRYSKIKNYKSPFELRLGVVEGDLIITSESSESRALPAN